MIYQDGELLELDPSFWQDFVEEIIPQGLVELFFFDGEKIQVLAEGSSKNLESSIKDLLNLSIIPSLSSDLQLIYKRHTEQENKSEFFKEMKSIKKKIDSIEKDLDLKRLTMATADNKVRSTKQRIENLESKLKQEGGGYYKKRDELKKTQSKYKLEFGQIEKSISQICESYIPLMLAPKLINRISIQLKREKEILKGKYSKDILFEKKALPRQGRKKDLKRIKDK